MPKRTVTKTETRWLLVSVGGLEDEGATFDCVLSGKGQTKKDFEEGCKQGGDQTIRILLTLPAGRGRI